MRVFLDAWLRNFLPEGCTFKIFAYQGKDTLLQKLPDRLKAYSTWLPDWYRVVVIVDLDTDDCQELKSKLERICRKSGLRSRRVAGDSEWGVFLI